YISRTRRTLSEVGASRQALSFASQRPPSSSLISCDRELRGRMRRSFPSKSIMVIRFPLIPGLIAYATFLAAWAAVIFLPVVHSVGAEGKRSEEHTSE